MLAVGFGQRLWVWVQGFGVLLCVWVSRVLGLRVSLKGQHEPDANSERRPQLSICDSFSRSCLAER